MHEHPHPGFCTDYTKEFLLETDASKEGLGAALSQKQADGQYHLVTYGSQALMAHEKNYHSTKLEFLAAKIGAVTEQFKEYLPYQPFLVRTDNNPLTYIMTIPNLNATGHQMGWSLSKVQLPVGVPERMRQHCGRHAEPNHYLPQPGGHAIHPRRSIPRCCSQGRGL